MTRSPPVRTYLWGVGLLLTVQGALGVLVRAAGRDPHAATRLLSDPLHSTIHLIWGLALLAVCVRRDPGIERPALLAFGVFYVGFLFVGILVHHPFGMQIDGKENAFHAVIGPLALAVWAIDRRRTGRRTSGSFR